jgi:hypothetical protein
MDAMSLISALIAGDANALAMVQNALAKSGKRIAKSAAPKTPSDILGMEMLKSILGNAFDGFIETLGQIASALPTHNGDDTSHKIQITISPTLENAVTITRHGKHTTKNYNQFRDATFEVCAFDTKSHSPKYVAMLQKCNKMA